MGAPETEREISPMNGEDVSGRGQCTGQSLTSVEKGFSYQLAASRCEEVSTQLVRLAELLRCTRPDPAQPHCALSECAMIECIKRGRRLREQFFDADLFADPAWDILLDLYLSRLDQRRTTVSNLCAAAATPATTALRYINTLVDRGLIVRNPSPLDLRVVDVELTDAAFDRMQQYFGRFSELLAAASGQ